jgi:DNA-binding NarL/FixJ family response regulator
MSVGDGETLDSLAHLIGVRDEDRAVFNRVLQANVSRIFPSDSTTDQVVVALKEVLSSDRALAQYAVSI